MAWRYIESIKHPGSVGRRCLIWLGVSAAVAATIPLPMQYALAADFSNAQKVYVPPSKIERRLDFAALRERAASANFRATPVSTGSSGIRASGSSGIRTGLIPPPPPVAPSILSGALVVPPPPPMMSMSTGSTSYTAPVRKLSTVTSRGVVDTAKKTINSQVGSVRQNVQDLIKAGKLDEAEATLRNALRSFPKDAVLNNDLMKVNLDRARYFLANKDFDSALKAAREAVLRNPSNTTASNMLDEILRQMGRNPADISERINIADLLASQGRSDAAAVEYRQALKIKPNAPAHVGLGNLALRKGDKKVAKQEYELALETDPNSALAHRQMGLFRLSQGDTVGANADLSRAVILDPNDKPAGKALVELWQRQVARAPGDANNRLGLARAYQITGNLSSAQSEYKQVVRLDPNNPNLPAARQSFKLAMARQEAERSHQAARTLESHGALPEAYHKVTEALGFNPSNTSLRNYQGQLLEKMGNVAGARDAYMNVLKDDPKNATAAQRLKALSAMLPAVPSAAAAAGAALPAVTEGPPAATIPTAVSHDPVANLSNFMVSLRNHTLTEKKRMQDVEDAAHKVLHQAAQNMTAPALTSSLGAPPLSPASGWPAHSLSSAPAVAPPPAMAPAVSSTPYGAVPFAAAAGSLIPAAAAIGAIPGLLPSSNPTAQSSNPQLTYQRMSELEQQNQMLQAQLQQAHQALQGTQPPPAMPRPYTGPPWNGSPGPPAFAMNPPVSMPAPAPSIPVPGEGALRPAIPNMMPPPSRIRLELEGVKPSFGKVDLKVVLRNDQDFPLVLPAKTKAVLKNQGQADVAVKTSFPSSSVPAHGEIHGVITVPTKQLSPSADVVLLNLFPPEAGQQEIHLTTPISWR